METKRNVCGIDVSKDTLDLCFSDEKGSVIHWKISNDAAGHAAVLKKLGKNFIYVMESTGPYYLRAAFKLKEAGCDVRVENPIVIKRFIQMNMERSKSDKKDAFWIFRYGSERDASAWEMPSEEQMHCSQMLGAIDLLKRQLTMLSNQLHSIDQLPMISKTVQQSLKGIMAKLQKEVVKLEEKLEKSVEQWQGDQKKSLSSIPGLGKRAVAILIVYTEGFKKIQNYRQLIALSGLAPREYSSGTSVRGRKGICKMGNGHLRSVLYMCSLSAIKYNKACRDLYERMKKAGKKGKVALIAVCNKLLKQAFSIATKGTLYQADFKSSFWTK